MPDILDPAAPQIGVGTTTIYPLPPDLDGTIFDPPRRTAARGTRPTRSKAYGSSSTSTPTARCRSGYCEEASGGLILISAWLGWRNHPGELAQDRPRFGLAQIQPAPEQPPIQRPPDPVQPDTAPSEA